MMTRALTILFASALLFPQVTGCAAGTGVAGDDLGEVQSNDPGDGDEADDEEVGTAASAAVVKPNIFIIRHGETTDGQNITANGKTALQNGWGAVDCSLITGASVYYLYSSNDVAGSERYIQTKEIVKNKLNAVCPSAGVVSTKLPVADLSSFTASQAQAVYNKITEASTKPRIFVLGSFLLHKLTQASDCALADKTDCYFKDWTNFMAMWNATWKLDECQLGDDPNDRRFMYNFIFRFDPTNASGQDVKHANCVGWSRIKVNTYSSSKCLAEWDKAMNLTDGCSW
jgi:hypothetical protein